MTKEEMKDQIEQLKLRLDEMQDEKEATEAEDIEEEEEGEEVEVEDHELDDPTGDIGASVAALVKENAHLRQRMDGMDDQIEKNTKCMRRQGHKV